MAEFHVLGLYDDEEQVASSVKQLHDLGLPEKAVTVMSSIPLVERAPKSAWIRQRGAPFAVLGALLGIGLGLLVTAGLYLLYQINTGLQPLVPIPTSGIIIFELTMLGTMATTFVGFLITHRLPAFGNPTYDARITEGKIGILVSVGDNLAAAVEDALKKAGAAEVNRLSPREPNTRTWNLGVVGLIVAVSLVVIVALLFWYDYLSIPFPTNMGNQLSTGFQEGPRLAAPAEAVPIQGPALIADQPASLPIAATADSLQRGQVLFNINCVLCHGAGGKGDGPLSIYFTPAPFDLTGPEVRNLSDQRIFTVISQGFVLMPEIGENLSVQDRWDVINHVRSLEK
jgi:mono/diheme cytochrome c family protein